MRYGTNLTFIIIYIAFISSEQCVHCCCIGNSEGHYDGLFMCTQVRSKPTSPPLSAVRVAAAVAPCARDPRIRTELPVDPRLQSSSTFHQTAVVLPTQAKPPSSTVTAQSDGATQVQPQTAGSSNVENIFDRLLKDLKTFKSGQHVADDGSRSVPAAELKTAESCVAITAEPRATKKQPIVKQETDESPPTVVSPSPVSYTHLTLPTILRV